MELHEKDEAFDSYVESIFFTESDSWEEDGLEYPTCDTFHSETLTKLREGLEQFFAELEGKEVGCLSLLDAALEFRGYGEIAHDFWLTRNGHGAGFWDGRYSDTQLGDLLTEVAKKFGEAYLYVGDDGLIYL